MRFSLAALSCLFLLPLRAEPLGVDTRRVPTAGQVEALVGMGWEAGAERLGETLVVQYQPGRLGLSGSTGRESFRIWMQLWRWFELMQRSAQACLERLIAGTVFRASGEEGLKVVPPGLKPPAELLPSFWR